MLLIIFAILIISIIAIATTTNLSITDYMANVEYHSTNEEGASSNSTDLAGLFWMNRPRCDSVSHDLPIIKSPFVGREVEMNRIMHYIHTNTAHIININGAPGFGKSSLAIHIGYEMVKEGSTVRYIDAVDKLANSKHFSNSGLQDQTEKHKVMDSKKESIEPSSSKAVSLKQPLLGSVVSMKGKNSGEHTDIVVEQLLNWSKEIQCPTVLILDNCDDLIYYDDVIRENLIQLVKVMVQNSKYQLHVIITSRKLLYILDDFESLVVKELSQAASVHLLRLLAPNISASHAENVSALVEGCPIALKVVGMLLHRQEDRLSEILFYKLQQNPIQVLDKVSERKERFRTIMDLVYEQLGMMQECGHYICLFPGSFSHATGSNVILNDKCLDSFIEQSLLDIFYLADQTRYKMHLLIRQYFREKDSIILNVQDIHVHFETNYRHYFTGYILKYANLTEATEKDKYLYSLEMHNIHHYLSILIPRAVDLHTNDELAVLAYAISEKLIPVDSVKNKFNAMIQNTSHICTSLKAIKCGEILSYIIRWLFLECRCETTYEYLKQILHSPCNSIFQSPTVEMILNQEDILLQLQKPELLFLILLRKYTTFKINYFITLYNLYGYFLICLVLYFKLDKFYLLIYCFSQLAQAIMTVIYTLKIYVIDETEWMLLMTTWFPLLIITCLNCANHISLTLILYSRYRVSVILINNRIRHEYYSLSLFRNEIVIFTFILVITFILFDLQTLGRVFPICY